MASLRKFGQRKPIVANRANRQIEAGNATWEAARQLGWDRIAVVWVEDDPASQTGFALADNRTAETAEWLEEALAKAILSVLALGPARYFVPVCKHPRDYQITQGPLGYEEVDEVTECPICVEPPGVDTIE